jgi:hypothetical protein
MSAARERKGKKERMSIISSVSPQLDLDTLLSAEQLVKLVLYAREAIVDLTQCRTRFSDHLVGLCSEYVGVIEAVCCFHSLYAIIQRVIWLIHLQSVR